MKTLLEVKEMLGELHKKSGIYERLSITVGDKYACTQAWIEVLTIVLRLYNEYDLNTANEMLFLYKEYLVSKYEDSLDVYQRDTINGWLKCSIETIDWFLS